MRPELVGIHQEYREYFKEYGQEVDEIIQSLPVYDLNDCIENTDESLLHRIDGTASNSIIVRIDELFEQPATLKIAIPLDQRLFYFFDQRISSIADITTTVHDLPPKKSLELADKILNKFRKGRSEDLALRQIWGHTLGSIYYPDFIDPPLGIWVTSDLGQTTPTIVGYSLPFVEGTAIPIQSDTELQDRADELSGRKIYVGNRTESHNAVINPATGVKKFIDVEIR